MYVTMLNQYIEEKDKTVNNTAQNDFNSYLSSFAKQ